MAVDEQTAAVAIDQTLRDVQMVLSGTHTDQMDHAEVVAFGTEIEGRVSIMRQT